MEMLLSQCYRTAPGSWRWLSRPASHLVSYASGIQCIEAYFTLFLLLLLMIRKAHQWVVQKVVYAVYTHCLDVWTAPS